MASSAPALRGRRRGPTAPWLVLAALPLALTVLLGALTLLAGRFHPAPAGLPDAGALTWWALPMARLGFDLVAVGTLGALLAGALLVPADAGRLAPLARRVLRGGAWWAAGWCLAAVACWWLLLGSIVGVPPVEVVASGALREYGFSLDQARAALATSAGALLIACTAPRVRTTVAARLLLALGILALLPTLLTGHAAGSTNHELASTSLVLHVVAASLWVGGLLALVLQLRGSGTALCRALPRFSALAGCCFVLVAASGLLGGYARLGASPDAWASSYGAALVAKAAVLLGLGAAGWWHRRSTIPLVLAGRPGAFVRLALAELLLMATAVALAVALSRTPFPAAGPARAPHGSGHALLGYDVAPLSAGRLLTQWRPDALVFAAAGLAATGYLLAVRRVARRGVRWPRSRVALALAGIGLALCTLCGGPATYSRALLSMQVGQLLVLLLVVPALVTAGQPVRLVLLAGATSGAGVRTVPPMLSGRAVRALLDPVNGLLLVLGLLLGGLASPLLAWSLRGSEQHLLLNVLTLAVGLAFCWSMLCRDWLPRVRPGRDRAVLLLVLVSGLALLGGVLRTAGPRYGGAWYAALSWEWSDPVIDQRMAAVAVWGVALLVGLLLLVTGASRRGWRRRSAAGTG